MDRRVVLMLVNAAESLPVSAAFVVTARGMSIAMHRTVAKILVTNLLFLMLFPLFMVDIAGYEVYTDYKTFFCPVGGSVRIIMIFMQILHFLTSGLFAKVL